METKDYFQINLSDEEKRYTVNSTLVPMVAYFLPYLEANPDIAKQIIDYAKPTVSGGARKKVQQPVESACPAIVKIALSIFFVWIIVFIMLTVAKAIFAVGFQIVNGVILRDTIIFGNTQVKTATGTTLISYLANLLEPLYAFIYPETMRQWSTWTYESAGILYAHLNKAIADFIRVPVSPLDPNYFTQLNATEYQTVGTLFEPFFKNFNNTIGKHIIIPEEVSNLVIVYKKIITVVGGGVGGYVRSSMDYLFYNFNIFNQNAVGPELDTIPAVLPAMINATVPGGPGGPAAGVPAIIPQSRCPNWMSIFVFGQEYCIFPWNFFGNGNPNPKVNINNIDNELQVANDVGQEITYFGNFLTSLKSAGNPVLNVYNYIYNDFAGFYRKISERKEQFEGQEQLRNLIPEAAQEFINEDPKAKSLFVAIAEYFFMPRNREALAGGELVGGNIRQFVAKYAFKYFPRFAPVAIPIMAMNMLESQTLLSFFSLGFVVVISSYDFLKKLFLGERYGALRSLFLTPYKVFFSILKKVFLGVLGLLKSGSVALFNMFHSIAEMLCVFISKKYGVDTSNPKDNPDERKPEKMIQAALGKNVNVDNKKVKKKFMENVQEEKPLSARENIHEAVNNVIAQLAQTDIQYQNENVKEIIVSKVGQQKNKDVNNVLKDIVVDNVKQLANQVQLQNIINEDPVPLNENNVQQIIESNIPKAVPMTIVLPRKSPKKKRASKKKSSKRTSKKKSSKKSSKKKSSKKKSSKRISKKKSVKRTPRKKQSKKKSRK